MKREHLHKHSNYRVRLWTYKYFFNESHIIKHTFSMKERTDTFLNFKHILVHDCAYIAGFFGSTTAFI